MIRFLLHIAVIVVFTIFSIHCWSPRTLARNCSVSVAKANQCSKVVLQIGNREAFIPRNPFEDGDKYCKIMNDNLRCLASHAKCYTPFTRQSFGVFIRSMKKEIKNQCGPLESRRLYLKHVACIENHRTVEKVHQCMDKLYAILHYVEEKVDVSQQIQCACCGYQLFNGCMLTEADKACRKRTGPDTAAFLANAARNMTADILDLLCAAQNSISICESKYGSCMRNLRKVMTTAKPTPNTIIFPLLALAVSHDN